jgi:hypothetical protein
VEERNQELNAKGEPYWSSASAVLALRGGPSTAQVDLFFVGGTDFLQFLPVLGRMDFSLAEALDLLMHALVTNHWQYASEKGVFLRDVELDQLLQIRTAAEFDAMSQFVEAEAPALDPGSECEILEEWMGHVSGLFALRNGRLLQPAFIRKVALAHLAGTGVTALDMAVAVKAKVLDGKLAGFAERSKASREKAIFEGTIYAKAETAAQEAFLQHVVPMSRPALKEFLNAYKAQGTRAEVVATFLGSADSNALIAKVQVPRKIVFRYCEAGGKFGGIFTDEKESPGLGGKVQEFGNVVVVTKAGDRIKLLEYLRGVFKQYPLVLEKLEASMNDFATKRVVKRDKCPYTIKNPQPAPAPKIVGDDEYSECVKRFDSNRAKLYRDACATLLQLQDRICLLEDCLQSVVFQCISKQRFDFEFFTKGHAESLLRSAERADQFCKKLRVQSSDPIIAAAIQVFEKELMVRAHNRRSLDEVLVRAKDRAAFHQYHAFVGAKPAISRKK